MTTYEYKRFRNLLIGMDVESSVLSEVNGVDFKAAIDNFKRGYDLLHLGELFKVNHHKLILAKARCARTVLHLMNDKKSVEAVDIAEAYGLYDKVSLKDLNVAEERAREAAVDIWKVYDNAAKTISSAWAYTGKDVFGSRSYSTERTMIDIILGNVKSLAYAASAARCAASTHGSICAEVTAEAIRSSIHYEMFQKDIRFTTFESGTFQFSSGAASYKGGIQNEELTANICREVFGDDLKRLIAWELCIVHP